MAAAAVDAAKAAMREPSSLSCVVCQQQGRDIVADCNTWRLPSTDETVTMKIEKWQVAQDPVNCRLFSSMVDAASGGMMPLCQLCLDLVTQIEQLETKLDEKLRTLWNHLREPTKIKNEPLFDDDEDDVDRPVDLVSFVAPATHWNDGVDDSGDEADPFGDASAFVQPVLKTSPVATRNSTAASRRKPVKQESPPKVVPAPSPHSWHQVQETYDGEPFKRKRGRPKKGEIRPPPPPPKPKPAAVPPPPPVVPDSEDKGIWGSQFWLKPDCRICDQSFPEHSELVQHFVTTHPATPTYACHFCLNTFIDLTEFTTHVLYEELSKILSGEFACKKCGEDQKSPSLLGHHFCMVHAEEGTTPPPFHCSSCGENYSSFDAFVKHRRSPALTHIPAINRMELKCELCGFEADEEAAFRIHARGAHESVKPYKCPGCETRFSQIDQLQDHLTTMEFDKSKICYICGFRLLKARPEAIAAHIRRHEKAFARNFPKPIITAAEDAKEKKFKCNACEESFANERALSIHQATHIVSNCPTCGKEFRGKNAEKAIAEHHAAAHEGKLPFACQHCEARFARRIHLKKHEAAKHPNEPKKYPCDKCENVFDTPKKLHSHKQVHGTEMCPICGKVLKGVGYGTVKKHIESTHERKKKYECQFCGEKYIRTQQLYKHQANVHGYKKSRFQFPCSICGTICRTKTILTQHLYIRHDIYTEGVRVSTCERCGKRFIDDHRLKEHMLSHDGIKPHACPQCDHRTVSFINLKTHMKFKHKRIVTRIFREDVGDGATYDIVDVATVQKKGEEVEEEVDEDGYELEEDAEMDERSSSSMSFDPQQGHSRSFLTGPFVAPGPSLDSSRHEELTEDTDFYDTDASLDMLPPAGSHS